MKKTIKIIFIAISATVALFVASCTKETPQKEDSPYSTLSLVLSEAPQDFGRGQTATMTVSLEGDASGLPVTYMWDTSRPSVVAVEGKGETAKLTAIGEGHAVVYAYIKESPDILATVDIDVHHVDDGIVRILAIGNSFSQDAVEQYLYDLFKADGTETIIGNMYIGGCPLEKHWNNVAENKSAYEYRKVVGGVKTNTKNVSIDMALADENWDYISFQQASDFSGMYEKFEPWLGNLVQYVSKNATNMNMKLMFHQTWAYAKDSDHKAFPNYDRDQMKMYNAVVSASRKAVTNNGIDILIPSGTAIQNGRTTSLGDTFNRDGYHLEVTYGRFTAACTWYECISGKSVLDNSFVPPTLDDRKETIAKNAAHNAVLRPDAVTDMPQY